MSKTAERGRLASLPGGVWLSRLLSWLRRVVAVRGKVVLAADVQVGAGSVIRSLHGLSIGEGSSIGRNCTIEVNGEFGKHLLTAAAVGMVGRNDHDMHQVGIPVVESQWIGKRACDPKDKLVIGNDVWVGYGAVILSGLSIGHGAVIGAGAVVVSDVPDLAIVGGNPARVLGYRFSGVDAQEHLSKIVGER